MSRLLLTLAVALSFVSPAAGAAGATQSADLVFYPQAGILGRDLYVIDFVDLDPGPGIRDFACGAQTYDGHTEDPDFEIVRYRYRWTAGRRLLRTVSSAALSDVLAKGDGALGRAADLRGHSFGRQAPDRERLGRRRLAPQPPPGALPCP